MKWTPLTAAFLSILWLGAGCELKKQSPSPFHVFATVDTVDATVGDIIHFQVWAKGAGDRLIRFPHPQVENPEISVGERFELTGEYRDDYGVEFEIAFWDTGKFTIPSFPVQIMTPAPDSVLVSMSTDPLTVTVHSVIDTPQPTLRDIKPPVPIPVVIPFRVMATLGGIAVLIGVLVWLWKKRILGVSTTESHTPGSRPGHEIALEKLGELRKRSLATSEEVKLFYGDLSYVVREFLEYQYFVRAVEMTTEEIELAKALFPVGDDSWMKLMDVLRRADLVKFAKLDPGRSVCTEDLQSMEEFVEAERMEWSLALREEEELEGV